MDREGRRDIRRDFSVLRFISGLFMFVEINRCLDLRITNTVAVFLMAGRMRVVRD